MVTLWIGDSKARQLQNIHRSAQQVAEYHYLTDDLAEYSWFINNVIPQIPLMSLERANVVIMLGFNDCLYSCAWDYDINKIAEQYITAINSLVNKYPNFNFYNCSVNPTDIDYPFSLSEKNLITKSKLDEKIKLFNSKLAEKCKATYIDSYTYLANTVFNTRDGVHYTPNTCNALHNYITSKIKYNITASFLPRISEPDPDVDSYLYWTPTALGGVNPFKAIQNESVLPSSTAYVWGRFYEIIGETPKLSQGVANTWYSYNDTYKRGSDPKVGAIACWASANDGYVAVVEQIQSDGTIITSESGWTSEGTWRLQNRTKGADGNWGNDPSFTFQGFIYCPYTSETAKEALCNKNSYSISVEEMKPNAQYIWQYLGSQGWTLNAVAGLLGNLQVESKMSPAIWESTIEGSVINADGTQTLNTEAISEYYAGHNRYPGYGLVQWTPYSKYTDWCADQNLTYWDIDSQLARINYEVENKLQWIAKPGKGYDLTFDEFISSTKNAYWLAGAFAFCYERPASSTGTTTEQNSLRTERGTNAEFWYDYLSSMSFSVSSNKPKISGFKIDNCIATQASVSFITSNCDIIKYTLLNEEGTVENNIFSGITDFKALTFNNLIPSTEYKVKLEAQNADSNNITRELSFTTLQDYPTNPADIELVLNTNRLFSLKITKPKYLGYWKDNSGYDISLIINNKVVKTITVNNAKQNLALNNFSLEEKFNYKGKVDDLIQVGVQTWVQCAGNKLYSKLGLKTSKPVCLLNNKLSVYLNR